eukprot:225770_1
MSNLDELLAQSIAMQDYIDFQTEHQPHISPTLNDNSNNTNNSNQPHSITNTDTINNNPLPQIFNQQCLPTILSTYITNKSLIDLSKDISSLNPDIYKLFSKYNYLYFDNKLSICEVKWSKRMTLCAGLCCYEGNGGLCSIKLSESLLKYRTTKETIETLIHEMIHAYLFITFNNKDRQSHGNTFKTLMNIINYVSNLNISIYHTFNDEVDQYRKHIWKCNGPCQYIKPYFGIVKRSMNRPPGPNDNWYGKHMKMCGGSYSKISEPKEFTEKQKKKKEREERKKLKEMNKGKNVNVKKGKKRKRDNDSGNGQTLLDMFDSVKGNDNGNGKEECDEPVKKRRKIDNYNVNDESVDGGDNSDLEILDVVDNGNNSNNGNDVKVKCPICEEVLNESVVNLHLDDCLK